MFTINYNGVNLLSNTTIWWRDVYIYIYYYIEYNHMFRRLIMAIFRLYMNHLISSYTNKHTHTHTHIYIYIYIYIYMGYLYEERGGGVE